LIQIEADNFQANSLGFLHPFYAYILLTIYIQHPTLEEGNNLGHH